MMEHPVHGRLNFHSLQMVVKKQFSPYDRSLLLPKNKYSVDSCRNKNSTFEKFLECGIHFNPSSGKEKFHTSGVTTVCSKV